MIGERYSLLGFEFDVEMAKRIVSGRPPVKLSKKSMRAAAKITRTDPDRVARANIESPGIIAQLPNWFGGGGLLIDGNHRAQRAIQLNKPFTVRVLTPRETERIMCDKERARQIKRKYKQSL